MSIAQNVARLLEKIQSAALSANRQPNEVSIVAVTKNQSHHAIQEAYDAGCRDFGENKVQEALPKIEYFSQDIRWHYIGALQKNKISKVLGKFVLIHSVDTPELAEKIAEASVKVGIQTSILLESNTSGESSKSGLSPSLWQQHFPSLLKLKGITIHGLMTMAPLTEDESLIRHCFAELRYLRDSLQDIAGNQANLSTLSMGMSNDFEIAIQEGATLLRIGSALFAPKGETSL